MIGPRCAAPVLLAAFALLGCAGDRYRLDTPRTGAGVELAPYGILEECVSLVPGSRFDYYFTSVAPVTFNIHYHDANAVIMPVVREGATREAGTFTADRKQVYCLMWEAGAEPSLLDYRIRPLPER
jgi:hypothetical protein